MARLWKEKARRASNEEDLQRSSWFQFRKLLLPMMRGESIREYVERNLDQSLAGQVFDVVIILLSLFQVLVFVVFNRDGPGKDSTGADILEPLWSEYIEIIFGVIFTFDYVGVGGARCAVVAYLRTVPTHRRTDGRADSSLLLTTHHVFSPDLAVLRRSQPLQLRHLDLSHVSLGQRGLFVSLPCSF